MTTKAAVSASVQRRRRQREQMRASGWLSVAEVATKCGVTKGTVKGWITTHHLAHLKAGKSPNSPIYIDVRSVIAYLGNEASKALGLLDVATETATASSA